MSAIQEAFEKATLAVIAQGRVAYDADNAACRYRAPDGAKCFVGHLIPDEQYMSDFEFKPLDEIERSVPAIANLPRDFLIACQRAHDGASDDDFVKNFTIRILNVAKHFHLSTEFLAHV
jgi:hypothetical protein